MGIMLSLSYKPSKSGKDVKILIHVLAPLAFALERSKIEVHLLTPINSLVHCSTKPTKIQTVRSGSYKSSSGYYVES